MSDAVAAPTVSQIYKVAVASIVGSVIEQYDFLVTGDCGDGLAGDVFFKEPGLKKRAAAIATYGLGIIIRPLGAYIFGYMADRNGRKDALSMRWC